MTAPHPDRPRERSPSDRRERAKSAAGLPADYQPKLPGPPLNGPTTFDVIQPP
jgi:hypothetical protein